MLLDLELGSQPTAGYPIHFWDLKRRYWGTVVYGGYVVSVVDTAPRSQWIEAF